MIFDEGYAVTQLKLTLLKALNLQLVGAEGVLQGRYCRVEVAMLLLQPRQLILQLTLFILGHINPRLSIFRASRGYNYLVPRFAVQVIPLLRGPRCGLLLCNIEIGFEIPRIQCSMCCQRN